MEPRTIARLFTLGRVAIGAALIASPTRAASGWIGPAASTPEAQVVLAGLGARDIVLGLGGAVTAGGHGPARPWLLAAALSDLADLAAAIRHRDALPVTGVVGVGALAAGGAATGLWLATELD